MRYKYEWKAQPQWQELFKMPEYTVTGYDAYGNRVTETINIPAPLSRFRRSLRWIARLFGYGKPRLIRSIKIRD
jgi:hypothetical protein